MKVKNGENGEVKNLNDLSNKFDCITQRCQRLEDVVNDLIV